MSGREWAGVDGWGGQKKKELRQEPSGLDGCLGEGDNWYKELESRGRRAV